MGIVFFILTVLVVPFMPAGATVPRWAFLSIVCAALLFKIEIPLVAWLLIGYVTVMTLVAPVGYDAAFLYWHFLLFVVVFLYAQRLGSLRGVAIGIGLAIAVNSLLVAFETFGYRITPSTVPGAAGGLFYNHNLASETAAMVAALAIGYRLWWLLPGLMPTLAFGSRAPVLALGVAGAVALWRKDRFFALLTLLGGTLVVAVLSSYRAYDWTSILQRVSVWQDTLPHLTLFGHGLGSFIIDFPLYQRHSAPLVLRFENAHNDLLQIAYELGIGGLLLVAALGWRMAHGVRDAAWYALLVFLAEGCLGFPLYEPVTGALAALCAGWLFTGRYPLRDLLDTLGSGVRRWHENHAGAELRGVGPAVSPTADPTFGGGLRGHIAAGSIEDRYRRAGAAL